MSSDVFTLRPDFGPLKGGFKGSARYYIRGGWPVLSLSILTSI